MWRGVRGLGEKALGRARHGLICIDLKNIFLEIKQSLVSTVFSILRENIKKSSRPFRVLETVLLI